MAAPEVSICSRALVLLGDKPIATLSGLSDSQIACANLYDPTVKDLLGRYRWRFASRMVRLERTADVPLSVYDAAYQLPADTDIVYSVRVGSENIIFDRFERHIYCNASASEEVVAEVMIVPSPANWPPYFRTLVELQLAAVLAVPITEDATKASFYEGKALRQFALAKSLDSQTRTARKVEMTGLRRYHRGGP